MASQGTHPQNINDFDFLTYDSTLGDGSLNTTSHSLNDTFVNVHFQQHEYDHDGGQNVQSDAMFNVDPDNHFHASISTDTKYYSDEQFVRDVKSKGDLSFIHFNARSLNRNFHKIKDSIDDLKLSFDIIAISETWAETDTIDGFTLNGYEAFHIVRGQRKGGGVALYVHRRFNCAIRAVQCKVVEQVFECVTVELDLKKRKNITVSCVYRTPGSDVDLFCESLEQIFSDVMPRKSMFICGDFNIDLMKYETHNGTKRFLDCMYGLGFYPLIDRPSRITTHSCTLIDNIFTNQINYSIRSGLLMNDITDHLPIFALCNYEIENKKSDPVKYVRNLKNENVSLLIESLSQEMWNNVLQSDDVNVAYINFIETFSKLYNLHCPVKRLMLKVYIKSRGLQMVLKMHVVRRMVCKGHFFGREPTLQNTGIKRTKIN